MIGAFTNVIISSITAVSLILGTCQALLTAPAEEYDYSLPVPLSEQKGDEWFYDSAVIGHSLMEGFEMFSKVDSNIHYFTNTGLSAAGASTYSRFDLPGGGAGTLADGLSRKQFSKIYIMLGVNEISISRERFKNNMAALIRLIRENQPEGIPIYVLELTPTTRAKSNASDFNRENVRKLNEALAELCQEQKCYLVDLFSCFADEEGYLPAKISTDGVHLKAAQYRVMADYILSHTVG